KQLYCKYKYDARRIIIRCDGSGNKRKVPSETIPASQAREDALRSQERPEVRHNSIEGSRLHLLAHRQAAGDVQGLRPGGLRQEGKDKDGEAHGPRVRPFRLGRERLDEARPDKGEVKLKSNNFYYSFTGS